MGQRTVKSGLIASIILAIVACTNLGPNNNIPSGTNFSNQENFQDLDNEYTFSTKELTQSYLRRKLNKWLDTGSDFPNPNGPKLVKEISYARLKYGNMFCALLQENENMAGILNSVPEVAQRKEIDLPFREFIDNCALIPLIFGEFRVNSFTEGIQEIPDIAMDSTGDYVITWQSDGQNEIYHGIYAQRYSNTGEAVGSEFHVNTVTEHDQTYPAVAIDDSGDFVITWNSAYYDENNNYYYGIFAQRYNSQGSAVGSEFKVNTYSTGNKMNPAAAMDSAGNFVITWMNSGSQDGSGDGVFARIYDSAGVSQGTEFQVNSYTTNSQDYPEIAMNSSGDFVITWMSFTQDGDGYGIYAQKYNINNGAAGSEFLVNTFTSQHQVSPVAAMDSTGGFVITWDADNPNGSGEAIYAQRYNSDGSENGSQFQVNTFDFVVQRQPTVAMNSSGDFVISWLHSDQNSSGVFAQRYNNTGEAVGSEFQVNSYSTGPQGYPAVAVDNQGDFIVIWSGNGSDESDYGIFGQRYDSSGSPR
jgi:hypothetical protein